LEENLFWHNKFTFIHIGRLTQQKNQILLIRSFLDLNKIYPNMQLIILGEWELKNFLLKNCDSNKNIIFLWNKDNPYAYIRLSDTLVLSSEYEWYPTVLLESLACWTPTISTDCMTWPRDILAWADDKLPRYGNNFIVCKYWVLTPVNNQYVLTKAMEFMYLNPQKRLYYKKFWLRRSKFFDIKKVIIQWIDII
jgi:N-acetylgalactosamine-N,N'-diacetylbacillosaminyl-diphospho-undecaprenol 4-alpha-N-acetylgalactosaminyltransferase